jgi:hypothetical protein
MKLNKYLKQFLTGGLVGIGILFLYQVLATLSILFFGIFAIVLSWGPYLPIMMLFSDLDIKYVIILTFILVFLISGLGNMCYQKYKKNKKGYK